MLTSLILCCEQDNDAAAIEQQIFTSLLPEMIEAVYKDPAIYLNFPEVSKRGKIDSEHITTLTSRRGKNEKIIVFISDILNQPDKNDLESIQQIIKTNKLNIHISADKLPHKLVHRIYDNKRFSFKYSPEPSNDDSINGIIYTDGINIFHISVSFSKIQFDENKEYGIMTAIYDCRPKCGIGYVIVVKKESKGWRIYKVFDTWVS
ncbi:hypothetical protein [Dyadobacter sp. 3J3]|uniref:hypothetical protein n=1 Tax=Dyadobacter sp. 3J3 TaxID=2606600 RepID=UPI00135CE126|nr:hypothetical protein [Dyadobacter sp. 3J3]